MKRSLLATTIALFVCARATASIFYVSPTGLASNPGTIASPNSLTNMVAASHTLASAGDTIYMLAGTYTSIVTSTLVAPSNNPIVISSAPGQWAVVDPNTTNLASGAILNINGSGTWFRDFEISNSATNRYVARLDGVGLNTATAGYGNKVINLYIHDTGDGIFCSYQSTNAEMYGNVIVNNGYQLADRGHGHYLYIQNEELAYPKLLSDNIGINCFHVGVNLHYAAGAETGIYVVGNVLVNSGIPSTNSGVVQNIYADSGGGPVDFNWIIGNLTYYSLPNYGLGLIGIETNGTISVWSNVFAKSYSQIFSYTNLFWSGNTQYGSVDIRLPATNFTSGDFNAYYSVSLNVPVSYDTTNVTLAQWRTYFGNDIHGTSTASSASGTWAYVRTNSYDTNRANITVYNWGKTDSVPIDISSFCPNGYRYTVRNAADYTGAVVSSAVYSGGNITIPMTNLNAVIPIGMSSAATNTAPEFAAFVVSASKENSSSTIQSAVILNATFR